MSPYKIVPCPNCGATADKVDRFAAMVVCEYCGGAMYFDDEAVLAMGQMAILVEYPTPLYVHAEGSIRGERFEILGRVRYRYSRGFWDEWYLRFKDGKEAWISEDEMEFSFERPIPNPGTITHYNNISPGSRIVVAGKDLIVDEKDIAEIEGAEGSLPWVLSKDRQFPYVEASQGDNMVTLEWSEDGLEVFEGVFVDVSEIKLDRPKEDEADYAEWSDA